MWTGTTGCGTLTFNLEEGWEELEFILLGGDGISKLLAIVEGLQKGLEAIVYQRHLEGHRKADI